jgi:1-pyrroline-5-carboxylate dehydrogenase
MKDYSPEVYFDFLQPATTRKQRAEIDAVRKQFGKEYPNIIGGKQIKTSKKTISTNPARPQEQIGIFQKSAKDDAERAMQAALKAFETWKNVPVKQRANVLFKAANIIRRRRMEINAWMISEVGKNYLEADADTCEAIDFLEFYGREALRYAEKQPIVSVPGEKNELFYIPLGVGVVIPPWNFPFAILVGMSSAAIVTGNTIVLKPSSESPMMGWIFTEIMQEAGLPEGVLNFLVASGGKDAIIVCKDANIDEAVAGVVAAAFGFQGQKCSACSRAIIEAPVYDAFVAKLKVAVDRLQIGDPANDIRIGPVVSAKAYQSILEYIEVGKTEGKLLNGGGKVEGTDGYYIKPTVFVNVKPTARLMQEEIFGPVLAVCKAKDYDDALKIANNTIYGLTGAVYSKSAKNLERARQEFHCGNLYLNRKCTGALVGVHPFGGFNMSGTDSKAGGRDYLMLFCQAKVVTKKA